MAKGMPDWSAEARPYLGVLYYERVLRVHPGVETYTMMDIAGKGVILGGSFVHAAMVTGHHDCLVELWIDGLQVFYFNFATFLLNNWHMPDVAPMYLTQYDPVNHIFNLAFSRGWTFGQNIRLLVEETVGGATSNMRFSYTRYV